MSVAGGGADVVGGALGVGSAADLIFGSQMVMGDNGKLKGAASVDSLENCSTMSSNDPSNQVRTLFVSGLPMDAKQRELYLLFRGFSGYESALLKVTNKNGKASAPVGFVTFATHQDANEAKRKLQGVRFDPELSQTIRLELARSNTKVSKPKQPSPPVYTPGLSGAVVTPTSAAAFLSVHAPDQTALLSSAAAAGAGVFDPLQALNDQSHLLAANGGLLSLPLQGFPLLHGSNPQFLHQNATALAMAQLQQQHQQQQQQQQHQQTQLLAANGMLHLLGASAQHGTNPPCSTLFVANLGSNPNEDEIRALFNKCPGLRRLRLNSKGGSPVAFVEYQDVRHAQLALSTLQGSVLASSERGSGIRIEYARTKMGEGSAAAAAAAAMINPALYG